MKTITCRQMGGPCDTAFTGSTPKEVMDQGAQHVMASTDPDHMKVAEQMKTMSPEESAGWNKMYEDLWASTPDSV